MANCAEKDTLFEYYAEISLGRFNVYESNKTSLCIITVNYIMLKLYLLQIAIVKSNLFLINKMKR